MFLKGTPLSKIKKMKLELSNPIQTITTRNIVTVKPKTLMTVLETIFTNNDFHHVPVLDEKDSCVGIISKSDYHQLQDKFTRLGLKFTEKYNHEFFGSLLVEEVMTKDPITIDAKEPIEKALDLFLKNKFHALIVSDNGTFKGITTTYDLLQLMHNTKNS